MSLKNHRYVMKGINPNWTEASLKESIARNNPGTSVTTTKFLGKSSAVLIQTAKPIPADVLRVSRSPHGPMKNIRLHNYIEKRTICFNCQGTDGHRSNHCRSVKRCARCLQEGHSHKDGKCNTRESCAFCNTNDHSTLACRGSTPSGIPKVPNPQPLSPGGQGVCSDTPRTDDISTPSTSSSNEIVNAKDCSPKQLSPVGKGESSVTSQIDALITPLRQAILWDLDPERALREDGYLSPTEESTKSEEQEEDPKYLETLPIQVLVQRLLKAHKEIRRINIKIWNAMEHHVASTLKKIREEGEEPF